MQCSNTVNEKFYTNGITRQKEKCEVRDGMVKNEEMFVWSLLKLNQFTVYWIVLYANSNKKTKYFVRWYGYGAKESPTEVGSNHSNTSTKLC